jgi:integrase
MSGCRPFSDEEIDIIVNSLEGKYAKRNKAMVILGLKTGYRIHEILSLNIYDVYQFGRIVDRVSVQRHNMKGKDGTRSVPLHPQAKVYILDWINELITLGKSDEHSPLFPSRNGSNKRITEIRAYQIIKEVCNNNQLTGKIGTHSMRKTFANNVYSKLGHDLVKTQRAMGHAQVTSTARYITFADKEIEDAILN